VNWRKDGIRRSRRKRPRRAGRSRHRRRKEPRRSKKWHSLPPWRNCWRRGKRRRSLL